MVLVWLLKLVMVVIVIDMLIDLVYEEEITIIFCMLVLVVRVFP